MVDENMNPKVTLRSNDEYLFWVDLEVANMSNTLRGLTQEVEEAHKEIIPLQNVDGKILKKIVEYCEYHAASEIKNEAEIKNWDKDFVNIDQNTLFELILGANYLDIQKLLDLTCKTVADMIKGKAPEEIREMFGIVNDYTAAEEEEIRKENEWDFD